MKKMKLVFSPRVHLLPFVGYPRASCMYDAVNTVYLTHIEDFTKTYLATTELLHAVLKHLNTKSLILRIAQVVAVCPVDVPLGR